MRWQFCILLLFCNAAIIAQEQKNVVLLDQWFDAEVTAGPENGRFSDIWGFTVDDTNYVVLGSTEGAHFFQVKNEEFKLIDFKPGAFSSPLVRHRDYKTYRNYLYAVCDEGPSSLQVFDLSYLPDSVSLIYEDSLWFKTAHNIFVDTLKAKLYVCAPNSVGMQIWDLSDPAIPVMQEVFSEVPYVHDCYVSGDTAFLNCGVDGLQVYEFGGPVAYLRGVLDFYPNQGYNHSGWLNESRTKYVFADENVGTRLKLCKLGALSKIQIDETFGTRDYLEMVPHNVIAMERLAIVSYYNEGLRIYDIGNSPVREIASYDTHDTTTNYKQNGAWGVFVFPTQNQIVISDQQGGLFLFEFPIQVWENGVEGTFVTTTPFITDEGILIARDHFDEDDLFFSITDANGSLVYHQENYLNWLNIPLSLSPGIYIFGVFDADRQRLEGGKFVVAN